MAVSQAKENILKKIRQALSSPVALPFPHSEGAQSVFTSLDREIEILFAEEFTKLQGRFAFCENEKDLQFQLQHLIAEKKWDKIFCAEEQFIPLFSSIVKPYLDLALCDASITGCECLVARTGSIVLSAAQQRGRTASVYAPIHICIAYTNQLMYDTKDALQFLKEKYGSNLPSSITFAAGPSRTADIEKTLVTGVHGPKEAYCFLVEG